MNTVVPLYPEGQVPFAQGTGPEDTPSLTLYPADKPNGAAMVVCPGGGYGGLAGHEGEPIAKWLNSLGVFAVVLKYRLGPKYHHPAEVTDALTAIKVVRGKGREWNVDPKRVGILGFSAGGHLTSTAATHFTSPEDRPDLAVLCYPVITLEGKAAHAGSRRNLLGDNPPPELVRDLSNHLKVTKNTPPCFLMHTADDAVVPVENALLFASALAANGVPFAMQVYEHAPHGVGLGSPKFPETMAWPEQCAGWFKQRGFIPG